jgi:DNA-binding transcriptional regulator GbsR (MarR family)
MRQLFFAHGVIAFCECLGGVAWRAGRAIPVDVLPDLPYISVMTEFNDKNGSGTAGGSPVTDRFVLHWGEMGSVWGVNRSVGQIHGLLYLSDKPLTAEDIAERLGLARSNVSNSLKELQGWNLVRRVHVMGDRRDHFAAETDLWEMVTRIAEGRKQREVDPTIALLQGCMTDAGKDKGLTPVAKERLAAMLGFLTMIDTWSRDIKRVPTSKLAAIMKLGGAIARFVPGGKSKPSDAA